MKITIDFSRVIDFLKQFKKKHYSAQRAKRDGRMIFLNWLFGILTFFIIFRLFDLQLINHGYYEALASDQHEIYKSLFPQRGEIFVKDQYVYNGEAKENLYPLAMNKEYNLVYAQPKYITDPQVTAQKLAPLLGMDETKLLETLSKKDDPYEPIKRKVEDELAAEIMKLNLTGIRTAPENYRYYPEKNTGAQILGFIGYQGDNLTGLYGAEGYFNNELTGQMGGISGEGDNGGLWLPLSTQGFKPAIDGDDIVLTIDKTVEYEVCRILDEDTKLYEATSGTVIVMEPSTGKIIAMCTSPNFDPNEYSKVSDVGVFNNTAIYESYEPGSIFKPLTMAMAIDLGLVKPDDTYVDEGELKIDEFTIRNSDLLAHGTQTMVQILEKSLNLGAIYVVKKVGRENFQKYVQEMGFGQLTGIQLDREMPGDIRSLNYNGEVFIATASYGQGITTTPLQMVQAFSVIANNGDLVKPYIIDEIIKADGTVIKSKPQIKKQVISSKTATILSSMMVSVINNGHGEKASVPGYNVAGKTGTAQIAENGKYTKKTNHSLIGFAPLEKPAFLMLVKYKEPQKGTYAESTAAPTFGRIARFLLNYYHVEPDAK